MVSVAVAAVALTLLWLVVVEPLQQRRAMLKAGVPAQRSLLAWMQAQDLQDGATGGDAGSLFAVVDRSARTTRFADGVQRLQPDGEDNVRIWLEAVPYADLVRWLAALETDRNITPLAISLERSEDSGQVNARITLQRLH